MHCRPGESGPGRADQTGAEGGVPALRRRREAAAQAGPRAAARATRDLLPGCTTGRAAGAAGRAPRGACLRGGGTPTPGGGHSAGTGGGTRQDPTAGVGKAPQPLECAHHHRVLRALSTRFRRRSWSHRPPLHTPTHLPQCRRSPLPGPWRWALVLGPGQCGPGAGAAGTTPAGCAGRSASAAAVPPAGTLAAAGRSPSCGATRDPPGLGHKERNLA